VQHTIEQNKTAHSEAKANAETSRKRIARIKAGEEIGPQQPVDINRLMEETFGKRRLRYIRLLGLLSPEQFEEYIQAGRYHAALDSHRHTDLRKFIKNQPLDAFPPEKWVEIIELLYPNFVWPDHMMEEVE